MISESILEYCGAFVVEYFPKTAKVISEHMVSIIRKIMSKHAKTK